MFTVHILKNMICTFYVTRHSECFHIVANMCYAKPVVTASCSKCIVLLVCEFKAGLQHPLSPTSLVDPSRPRSPPHSIAHPPVREPLRDPLLPSGAAATAAPFVSVDLGRSTRTIKNTKRSRGILPRAPWSDVSRLI